MVFFVLFVVLAPHLLAIVTVYWWYRIGNYSGHALFLHLAGGMALGYLTITLLPWCYTSVYCPVFYGILWGFLLLRRIFRTANATKPSYAPWHKLVSVLLLLALSALHYWAQQPPSATVNWPLPLQGDNYYVQQGGHSWLTNPFHHRYHAQRQAIDIVQLNTWGSRATSLLPENLDNYYIYRDTVYSPVHGEVVRSVNNRPEPIPPMMDATLPLGNHVFIQKDDTLAILGHMIPGSVVVQEGEKVSAGTPVGLVGNSGRSSEPHLHYQIVRQTATGWEPIGIRWNGHYPSTGDRLAD